MAAQRGYSQLPGDLTSFSRQSAKAPGAMELSIDEVARQVVDAAVKLHMRIGPGLLESVYEVLLARDLQKRGLMVERQKPIDAVIDGVEFSGALRPDMIVAGKVVVEIKSAAKLAPSHWKQVLTYLRLLDMRVGLLLNFGAATMPEGIRRIANNHDDLTRRSH